MRTTIWWGYTTPHGNICQAFGAILCHFFPFSDVCRILFADPSDSWANPWRNYYVTLISSLNSLAARLTGWKHVTARGFQRLPSMSTSGFHPATPGSLWWRMKCFKIFPFKRTVLLVKQITRCPFILPVLYLRDLGMKSAWQTSLGLGRGIRMMNP